MHAGYRAVVNAAYFIGKIAQTRPRDPIIKERLFGLTNSELNDGETSTSTISISTGP
jgi:hypothetical protein